MRYLIVICATTFLVASAAWCNQDTAPGQPQEGLDVARAVIAGAVEEREPVCVADTFQADVERVYCFVEITGAEQETYIVHAWYWGDQEMARVELPVRSARWRTWSSKRIVEGWTGSWRVDVLDSAGTVLRSLPFEVSASKSE